ncbi:YetF domain-containing protein [Muricoccus pecuniae]|uniref:Uncharacterized membrane protein YcaP (DUF421 family) n=1 Tax=Muricoccus pecuniae TaxID=693023 RepID=A0A840Y9A9_9PROT|nr:YetF domain-containing protein [Roseomonas pecuniae]MBB5692957.1 uncharacterized membrane protein YcaP (DUF421 family) [Roseomonas pecuniae]
MSAAALFGETGHVGPWQECLRAVVVFAYGLLLVRLAGRRVFGKWSALDIIVSVIIGSNLSRALTGSAPLGGTLLATTLLLALHWLLAQGAARFRAVSAVVEGSAVELARDGAARPGAMVRDSISRADMDEALRGAGVEELARTRLVMLEPSGKITVLK